MESAAELVEQGRGARDGGDPEGALAYYELAAVAFEEADDLRRAAHARRHCADLLRELGRMSEARESIGAVIAFYRQEGTGALEMGNTLRVAALVEERLGEKVAARELWVETLGLYEEVGVEAGVVEVKRRLAELRILDSAG